MLRSLPLMFIAGLVAASSSCSGCTKPAASSGEGEGEGEGEGAGEGEGEGEGGGEGEGEGAVNQPGAPTTHIVSPADGAFIHAGDTTTFQCTAVDAVDGVIPNGSVTWHASGDGALGVGNTVRNALTQLGDQTIRCDAVNAAGLIGEDTVTVHVVDNLPPIATIVSPADGAFFADGATINFTGSAFDPETGPVANTGLHWTDGQNALGAGPVVATTLPLGDHVITLSATDPTGAVGTATATIHVVTNIPPQCTVLTPPNGSSVVAGASTTYSVVCSNPDGTPVQNGDVHWTSNVDGNIGTGLTVTNGSLVTNGPQVVTVCATDPADATVQGCVTVNITVGTNASPVATIQRPNPNDVVPACQDVQLRCSAVDPEGQPVTITWLDSQLNVVPAPQQGQQTVSWTPTTSGIHTLTCVATDSLGAVGTASVTITIQSPTARIQNPQNGDQFQVGNDVQLSGQGCDTVIGQLSGVALTWSDDVSGLLGTGNQLSVNTLAQGNHTITLTATNGVSVGTDTVQIRIGN